MLEPPSCLYRSVRGDEAIKNHILGRLWFRSPRYLRNIENFGADELEGIGSFNLNGTLHHDVGDSIPIQSAFLMSFSMEADATKNFGEHCFVVDDPQILKTRVIDALPPCITDVSWHQVQYTKTMSLVSEPDPSEDWYRKYFCKPQQFFDEKEWRLFISFNYSFRILNDTLKVHVNNLQGIFRTAA